MLYKDMPFKVKERIRERNRQRYNENPEFYRQKTRNWRKKHYKRWIRENREKDREWHRKWRMKNREILRKKSREYHKKNIDILRLKSRLYMRKKRKQFKKTKGICISCGMRPLAKNSKYRCKKCIMWNKEYEQRQNTKLLKGIRWHIRKFRALQIISGERIPRCIICGETDIRVLIKNHKETPRKQLKKDRKGDLNTQIVNGRRKIKDLEVRCCNCNMLYEYERGNFRFFDKKALEKALKEKKMIRKSDFLK